MRVVAALGGNALLERGEEPSSDIQLHYVVGAVGALAPVAEHHDLVITHGNGPQVGILALESAADRTLLRPYPLDTLGAQTQGMIGYWLLQALENALPGRQVVSLVSQTLVDQADKAFAQPTKFVGPTYDEAEAKRLAAVAGWQIAQDGKFWRRVVPSPEPRALLEVATVSSLVAAHAVVVCVGGGGIPVCRGPEGLLHGVDAVIDKDLSSALLARDIGAEALLLLTDVDGVELDFDTAAARTIRHASPAELRAYQFPAGSMGPKVDAACRFVESTGHRAMIGHLDDARELVDGKKGTVVAPRTEAMTMDPFRTPSRPGDTSAPAEHTDIVETT